MTYNPLKKAMIRSLIIQPQRYYPHARKSNELPRGSSYDMAYGEVRSWQIDDSWCSIQWYKSKYILPYCIEIEAKEQLYLPVSIGHPDIHWQYIILGGYGIKEAGDHELILAEGYQHKIYADCCDFMSFVPIGRHLIVGYSIISDWLDKHRNLQVPAKADMPHTLLQDRLYRNDPAPITPDMLTELYYILEHPRISGIQQDTNIYAAVGRLQSLHEQQEKSLIAEPSTAAEKIKAIQQYIVLLIAEEKIIPSIAEIADLYHIDKDHLSKTHKKLHKQSLQDYINDKRLEYALLLLQQGISVGAVTYRLHYHDIPAFSNAFLKKYGIRPSEYHL
ncbi:helix-turn-helix transcriptional regulator [Sphingobacterium sp. UT-1RO-CII-1]|uniref:helix-turn-helix transcriptional regulator n=1 Tax=Sphingobacterium sp. UT-1RO-CII-1 TaxID=2995225 RepID=UPI00227BD0DF|nr:helix-turn-helix transcriptional regulator [Sphingobacterium sp. UT-1RO-CII-1]MCY4780345.1 helix-turn-helix transcriptional regulator [Sphingobacterium sp. UT-1RO-CII-1]